MRQKINGTKYIKTDMNAMRIGSRIRQARELRGISQRKLAEELGFERKKVTYMEIGRSPITVSELILISKLLNQPFYYFVQDCR